jgi:hypothetical protein
MRHIAICGPSGCTIFFHIISENQRFFENKPLNIKCVFGFLYKSYPKTCFILRAIERDIVRNVHISVCCMHSTYIGLLHVQCIYRSTCTVHISVCCCTVHISVCCMYSTYIGLHVQCIYRSAAVQYIYRSTYTVHISVCCCTVHISVCCCTVHISVCCCTVHISVYMYPNVSLVRW